MGVDAILIMPHQNLTFDRQDYDNDTEDLRYLKFANGK